MLTTAAGRQSFSSFDMFTEISIPAALADTDDIASLYFLAPLPELWLGMLKELLIPIGRR